MRTRRRSLALALGLVLLTGCAAATGGGAAGAGTAGGDGGAPVAASAADEARDGEVREGARLFVVEAVAEVAVDDPRRTTAELATYVERIGGHVQERVEHGSTRDGDASAYLVVRVPTDRLTETIATLEEVGEVTSTSTRSTEVTGESEDLAARIRALEISVERLERLLEDATTTAELVSAEQALTERQEQLEQLQSRAARLADQVALATLEIHLWTHAQSPVAEPSGFVGGLRTGWRNLVAAVGALLVALGVLLPWLLAAAVVGGVVLLVLRARGRGRATPTWRGTAVPWPGRPRGPGDGAGTAAPAPGAAPEEGAVRGDQSSASDDDPEPGSPSSATTSA